MLKLPSFLLGVNTNEIRTNKQTNNLHLIVPKLKPSQFENGRIKQETLLFHWIFFVLLPGRLWKCLDIQQHCSEYKILEPNSVINANGSVINWSQRVVGATFWPGKKASNGCWKPKVNTKQHTLVSLHVTALPAFQTLFCFSKVKEKDVKDKSMQ